MIRKSIFLRSTKQQAPLQSSQQSQKWKKKMPLCYCANLAMSSEIFLHYPKELCFKVYTVIGMLVFDSVLWL